MANYMTPTSNKSKKVALFLCLFGGWCGLHQFYVGRVSKGLLYLCTVGFFGIGWFLDLITILLGAYTDNVGMPLRQ